MARFLLLASLAAAAWAQECDYSSGSRCIKPQASASAAVPFPSLFDPAPTFVYAIDELDEGDIAAQRKKNSLSIPAGYAGPVVKAAWWLQYEESSRKAEASQNRIYYAFALETNSTNSIGGDAGGCADLLGAECVKNLRQVLAAGTYNAAPLDGGYGTFMGQLYGEPPLNLSCPADLFGTKGVVPNLDIPLLLDSFEHFARTSNSGVSVMPSGNPNSVHSVPQLRYRSFAEQGARGIVGITVSWPASDPLAFETPSYSTSDVTVSTVCLRVGSVDGAAGGKRNGSSASRVNSVGMLTALVAALLLL